MTEYNGNVATTTADEVHRPNIWSVLGTAGFKLITRLAVIVSAMWIAIGASSRFEAAVLALFVLIYQGVWKIEINDSLLDRESTPVYLLSATYFFAMVVDVVASVIVVVVIVVTALR